MVLKVEHKLLMVFDRENYGGRISRRSPIPTLVLMDNLLSEKAIKPTITVVMWNLAKRGKDLISDQFGDFAAFELLNHMRSKFNIESNANRIILAGSSRGPYAVNLIALRHSI